MQETRVIGIDYGRRRIGMAASDLLRITAQPLPLVEIKDAAQAVNAVCKALAEYEVELIVVGRPGSLSGGAGQMAEEVEKFALKLRERGYKVELVDERLSSRQAKAVMRSGGKREKQMKGKTDTLAAQLILQSWLDRQGG